MIGIQQKVIVIKLWQLPHNLESGQNYDDGRDTAQWRSATSNLPQSWLIQLHNLVRGKNENNKLDFQILKGLTNSDLSDNFPPVLITVSNVISLTAFEFVNHKKST